MLENYLRPQFQRLLVTPAAIRLAKVSCISPSAVTLLAGAAGLPGINLVARGGYSLFARYRHLLPKKKTACEGGSCTLDHRR